MSVIIRLQNLPWSANALDIRQFFHGLSIPEGGVHIVGGERGDAFIAFSTDEDARQAFSRNSGKIKEVQISLMLSSRTEMQKVIEAARTQSYVAFMPAPVATPATITPSNIPLPAAVPSLIPAPVPEIKIDTSSSGSSKERDISKSEKRERSKRSRSRSRERTKDRSERRSDKKYRDRSRSRSRERRERRNRRSERSRSRGRSRSLERERSHKNRNRRRSDDYTPQRDRRSNDSFSNQSSPDDLVQSPPSLLSNFHGSSSSSYGNNRNGTQANSRNNWLPNNNNFNNMMSGGGGGNGGRQMTGGPGGSSGSFQNQRPRFQRNNFNQQEYGNEKPDREIVPNCCVKLQPFYGGYGDIRRFFKRAFISNVGIKFINNEDGFRTGMVYVQFGNMQGKRDALLKNGEHLNGYNVEVVHLDDNLFNEAVDRYKPSDNYSQDSDDSRSQSRYQSRNNMMNKSTKFYSNSNQLSSDIDLNSFTCLTVDDLPTYAKEQDILKLFSPLPLTSLILTNKPRGGFIAYVKFGSSDDAKKALEEQDNHIVEGKIVTVKPCSDSEFETVNKQHDVDLINDRKSMISPIDTDCISMSRLPQQTNDIEITDFFSDIGIRPIKIHLMSNRLGFTGQAFCEFKTNEDAVKSLKKDSASFGPNHVSIQLLPRDEMENILQQSLVSNMPMPMPNSLMSQQQSHQPLLQRPYFNQMNQTRPTFFQRNNNNSGGGNNTNNNFEGLRRGAAGPNAAGYRFMGQQMGGHRQRFMNINNAPIDDAPPGCTVYMDNVPYKAGTNEILDFFDGYDVTNNVSRRYNPNNTPSAEAKVVFTSSDEAYRAVQERNGQKIWERPIYLKQI